MRLRVNNVIDPRTGRTSYVSSADGIVWRWPDGATAGVGGVPIRYDNVHADLALAALWAAALLLACWVFSLWG